MAFANQSNLSPTKYQDYPNANKKYKDTLFRMIFSRKKDLLDLYNAVNDTDYKNPDDLEITTLDNAIYMSFTTVQDLNQTGQPSNYPMPFIRITAVSNVK